MFYERFLKLCERKEISPSAAATQAGFDKGLVSVWKKKYEAGVDSRPGKAVTAKICRFFDCSELWLLGLEEEQKKPTPENGNGRDDIDDLIEQIRQADDQTIEIIRRVVGYK
jgi:transcriptional regulator with XRE-family HTH domain